MRDVPVSSLPSIQSSGPIPLWHKHLDTELAETQFPIVQAVHR